jgi:hypothetical protein
MIQSHPVVGFTTTPEKNESNTLNVHSSATRRAREDLRPDPESWKPPEEGNSNEK